MSSGRSVSFSRRTFRVGVVATALAATLLALPAATVGAAGSCVTTNARTGVTGADLQVSLDLAEPGDRIIISGTCEGPFRVTRSVTLVGRPTYQDPVATLTGAGSHKVMRLKAGPGSTVSLVDLQVVHGMSRQGAGLFIHHGRVILRDTTIAYNEAAGRGGGVYNRHGTLSLRGSSSAEDNVAAGSGGGIFNHYGTLRLQDAARVHHNVTTLGAGGGLYNTYGQLTLSDFATVSENTAVGGGGIHSAYGSVLLSGDSAVTANNATTSGGGIHSGAATVVVQDRSSITGNAASQGGGVYSWSGQLIIGGDSVITGNVASDKGGGVFNTGWMLLKERATIVDNTAQVAGGGVRLDTYLGKVGTLEACQTPAPVAWIGMLAPNVPNDAPDPLWVTC